jgi:hypothetical protein
MPSTIRPQSAAPVAHDAAPGRSGPAEPYRWVGPVALATGACATAAGLALHLGAMPEDERLAQAIADDPQWAVSHVLLGIGFALVAIGLTHAVALARGRGAALTGVGALLAGLGAVLMSLSDIAHGAVGLALRGQVDAPQSLDIHLAYFEQPAVMTLNLGPMLLTLGLLVLGVGLLRSRTVPRWAGAAVLLTPIAVNASFALSLPPYLQAVPFLAGMLVLTSLLVRQARA